MNWFHGRSWLWWIGLVVVVLIIKATVLENPAYYSQIVGDLLISIFVFIRGLLTYIVSSL